MTARYEIIESEPKHVRLLAEKLRDDDRREIDCAGLPVMKAIWRSYRHGIIRRTAFVDNEIAAMFGLSSTVLLGNSGNPWLLTTAQVEKVPVSFVKEGRKCVQEMLDVYPVLFSYVDAKYARAIKFLKLLGFTVGRPEPFGVNGAPFCRFETRRV